MTSAWAAQSPIAWCSRTSTSARDYGCILDASGDTQIIDRAMKHLARHGEIVLAGFYSEPLHYSFSRRPSFAKQHSASQHSGTRPNLTAVLDLVAAGKLSLDGLVTHRSPAADAPAAYETAFTHPGCLKMVLDWRTFQ